MSAEDDMAWPTGTTIIPADPPSPLTAVRATDVYVAAFSDRLRYHGGINDGVVHAHNVCELLDLLDAALASSPAPAGRPEQAVSGLGDARPIALSSPAPAGLEERRRQHHWLTDRERSPAPAELDVERLVREMRYDQNLSGRDPVYIAGWDAAVRILLDRLGLRAATRPAEDADHE